MDTLDQYRQIVRNLLEHYAAFKSSRNAVKAEVIVDPIKDHYQLLYIGWDGLKAYQRYGARPAAPAPKPATT